MTGYSDSVYRDVPWAGRTLRVRVDYWAKPIPMRAYDFQATDDATYDGPGCPVGHGVTEEAATLGVPTVVLRRVTDRPEAIEAGIALRLDPTPDFTLHAIRVLAQQVIPRAPTGVYGDGGAARRIVTHLTGALGLASLRV